MARFIAMNHQQYKNIHMYVYDSDMTRVSKWYIKPSSSTLQEDSLTLFNKCINFIAFINLG